MTSVALALAGCLGGDKDGLAPAQPADTTVLFDVFHKPLPEIPVPNDIATRFDATSPTKLRLNASMVAPTKMEARMRELLDELDGWGVFQPIVIPFTGPLDVESILAGHRDPDYDPDNDVLYLIDVDRDSPEFGQLQFLDVGEGNYPLLLEAPDRYGPDDPRGWTLSLYFEEAHEDRNGNGELDPGEDTDADGILDVPNYLPGVCDEPGDASCPARDDLAKRADSLMTFYEKQTHALIVRPMVPLREQTTYAVVVTRRLRDAKGKPVGSPFPWIHHLAQKEALEPLEEVLPKGVDLEDVAFAYTFTTQSVGADWVAVREGLYGKGTQAHLAKEYPAKIKELHVARSGGAKNPYIAYTEQLSTALQFISTTVLGSAGEKQKAVLDDANKFIDFHVLGTIESPQLFRRHDKKGNFIPLNDQSWPNDLQSEPAETYPGTKVQCADPTLATQYGCPITFWLTVPRKEVSARGQGKPAPLVVWCHAVTSTKLEVLAFAGFLARYGFAVIAIDSPSHGIALPPEIKALVNTLQSLAGVAGPTLEAGLHDRAFDQTGDGVADVGADMFTAYTFHTRDMVRQAVLDNMQLIRIVRGFDGNKRWDFDVDGDGERELAGDFDADGAIDIGGDATFHTAGISMGGMISTALASVEPAIESVGPIAGGGGLADIGVRSTHANVPTATFLRLMGPVILGDMGDDGALLLRQLVPNAVDEGYADIARVDDVKPGDTMRVVNLDNGEAACALVADDGTVRTGIESDGPRYRSLAQDPVREHPLYRGDRLRVDFYRGPVAVPNDVTCEVEKGAKRIATVDSFELTDAMTGKDVTFQGNPYPVGSPLVALGDGLGFKRAHPDLRRSGLLGQLVIDRADPAVLARHLAREPLKYPLLGEETGAAATIVTNIGDMTVPTSTGIAVARAAGLIDYRHVDDRYGVPLNQELLDTFTAEAVNVYDRHTCDDPSCDGLPYVTPGTGIHLDVDNLSEGLDPWRGAVPRLEEPLRAWEHAGKVAAKDGSAAVFLYSRPEGKHEPPFPGEHVDLATDYCTMHLPGQDCVAYTNETFDTGSFLVNMLMVAAKKGEVSMDRCLARNDCPYMPLPPPVRVCAPECQ